MCGHKVSSKYNYFSSFTLIASFITLAIIGLALTPQLNLRLYPGRSKPSVTVSYQMKGANAVVIDSEVTSRLEGLFSRVEGLKKLTSRTSAGSGWITLEMDEQSDRDAVRFEVSALIRQVYPSLPDNISYPEIRVNRPDEEEKAETLITFTLNGPGSNSEIGNYANEHLMPWLSEVQGVNSVYIYGANTRRIDLVYNKKLLKNIGLSVHSIISQIREYYSQTNLGRVFEQSFSCDETFVPVIFSGRDASEFKPDDIQIKHQGRLFKLSDLLEVNERESDPQSYYRINGLNTVNIVVQTMPGANQIVTAGMVKDKVERIRAQLPEGYSILVSYDSSVQLREELNKIILRILSSVAILLLFVLLVSRSGRYLLVISFSILPNILIAFIFYHLLGIEIHMYSLAGITISLGILIDNTIVMADHLRNGYGISVFRAILAATLTTMGALVAVFFLDEDLQLRLIDFAWVIMINLGVSLLVSLFFIPSLLDKMPLRKIRNRFSLKQARRKVKLTHFYGRAILLMARYRWALLLIAVLGFGLPVYKLPSSLLDNAWYKKWYNHILGSQVYLETIKPVVDVSLGGTLRLFTEEVKHNALTSTNRRTSINISATMNDGSTLEHTNRVFEELENFLARYDEIEQFETRIYSPSSAGITVLFKPEHEFGGFPYTLKSEVESKVSELGSADWTVTGVGRAFDNSLNEGYRNSRIQLYGYNLEALKSYATKVKHYLEGIPRVEDNSIFINGRSTSGGNVHREYYLDMDLDKMRRTGISQGRVLNDLSDLSNEEDWVMSVYDKEDKKYVYLTLDRISIPDFWEINNRPLDLGNDQTTRLSGLGSFRKEREQDLINKENMEYTMVVEYNFIGSYGQKKYIIGQVEKRLVQELPVGYRIKQQYFTGGSWMDEKADQTQVWLLLLVAAIIFFICAIVFESLLQPLAVLMMVPLSFIGVFLTFYFFDLGFDQGGYASLLLLSGLTVNSALYILNDLNNIRKRFPRLSPLRSYLKAYNSKLIPVLLTLLSTVLGLVPFLSGGKKEAFWFSLAAGTIGGLLFSIVAIVVILPLFVRGIELRKIKGFKSFRKKIARKRQPRIVLTTIKN
jgi:multidrug efflux pump subunit AcrB